PETAFVVLPTVFRDAMVSQVVTDDLQNTAVGRFYPDFVRAQRFEYDKSLITGHLVEYGSSIDVMVQHDKVFGPESEIRIDNDVPLLRRFNARLFVAQDGRPTLFLVGGTYVLHVTVTPDPNNREIAKFLALLFAEEVVKLNPEVMTLPPYFVSLNPIAPPVPEWGAVVPPGDDLIVLVVLNYTLLDADTGRVTFTLERDVPFLRQEKDVVVTRGLGTVSFVDTLKFSADIPDTGANVTAKFLLTPPCIDNALFGSGAAEFGVDIGGGRFSHTAGYAVQYRLRK
ncbi:MAG: hypothetical protein HOH77_00340, partial [Candidatus Latescibacteria bacterium]|nr:hypothetical protein [Candidatus Latescibacterota bacterium]